MLRYDGKRVTDHRELAQSRIRIVAWGQDHDGDQPGNEQRTVGGQRARARRDLFLGCK